MSTGGKKKVPLSILFFDIQYNNLLLDSSAKKKVKTTILSR